MPCRPGTTYCCIPQGGFIAQAGRAWRQLRAALILPKMPGLRVVLVRTTGLWGSAFGYGATGKAPHFGRVLLRGALVVVANLLFFTPRRPVTVEFVEAGDLPRTGDKRVLNPWLEQFYNQAERPAQEIPHFFWQGSAARILDAVPQNRAAEAADISAEVRAAVYAALREAADLPEAHPLSDDMTLGGDLGLDSLALMDLALSLEGAQGATIANLELLVTVRDCLLAASGQLGETCADSPAPAGWFAPAADQKLAIPEHAATIADAFLTQVRSAPAQPLLADRAKPAQPEGHSDGRTDSGSPFTDAAGERLGIMLPAAPAVVTVWLAALLAGKTPVLFNWTVGQAQPPSLHNYNRGQPYSQRNGLAGSPGTSGAGPCIPACAVGAAGQAGGIADHLGKTLRRAQSPSAA